MMLNGLDEITIAKVQNGYIIKKDNEEGIDTNLVVHINEDIGDQHEAEQRALMDLFYQLQDFFYVYNSKHNKTRFEMRIINQETEEEIE